MSLQSPADHSQLLTLRMWPEELIEGRLEWRGRIQHVVGGETYYFRDWASMIAHLQSMLITPGAGLVPGPEFSKSVSAEAQESIPTQVPSEVGVAVDRQQEEGNYEAELR